MNITILKKILPFVLFFSSNIQAKTNPIIIEENEETYNHHNCELTKSCDLVKVKMKQQDYKIWIFDRFHYGVNSYFFYETKSVSQLENYGFVHFMKGCRYSHIKKEGEEDRMLVNFVLRSFNENIKYQFKDWQIDSTDNDPMAGTAKDIYYARHNFHQWNTPPYSTDNKTAQQYGDNPPSQPVLYLQVMPSQVFRSDSPGTASNNSLEIKTCLYKSSDIPETGTRDMKIEAKPLHCFYWRNDSIYDFQNDVYEKKHEINPFCLM